MSKSVDETVVDFFRLLLSEEEPQPQKKQKSAPEVHINSVTTHARVEVTPKPKVAEVEPPSPQPQVAVKPVESRPQTESLNKAALEKLLAPVFEEKGVVTKPKVAATPEVKVVAAEPKLDTKTATKAEKPAPVAELSKVTAVVEPEVTLQDATAVTDTQDIEVAPQTQTGVTPPSITKDLQADLDDEFQVLFFKVAGLTLAVPLVSLGGIVKVDRINQIFGRPGWFLGVQTHRDSQLNLVDTCAWVMPEKYDEELAQSVNYQYLVLLEDSNWGLACESLVNSVRIKQSEVNWRTTAGKRPWLAGVVKEQMCGILNVQALIQMLNAGLGCQDPIN